MCKGSGEERLDRAVRLYWEEKGAKADTAFVFASLRFVALSQTSWGRNGAMACPLPLGFPFTPATLCSCLLLIRRYSFCGWLFSLVFVTRTGVSFLSEQFAGVLMFSDAEARVPIEDIL